MLNREETWGLVKKHVENAGVIAEEVYGTCVFYHSSVRNLYTTKNRHWNWKHDIVRDKFSKEGLELLFQILGELMPDVFHRYEHECARQSITPEEWENQARLRELEKKIFDLGE